MNNNQKNMGFSTSPKRWGTRADLTLDYVANYYVNYTGVPAGDVHVILRKQISDHLKLNNTWSPPIDHAYFGGYKGNGTVYPYFNKDHRKILKEVEKYTY